MEELHRTRQKTYYVFYIRKIFSPIVKEENTPNDSLTSDDMHSPLDLHRMNNIPSVGFFAKSNVT